MSEFIVCSLADKKFALNFLEVEEVMNAKKGTPLPFSEAWHEGMVTIRGDVFTILNLRKKLLLPASSDSSEDKMILLSRAKIALLVDQVEDTASAEDSQLQNNEEEWQRELFPTVMEHRGALIPVIDMDAFLASPGSAETPLQLEYRQALPVAPEVQPRFWQSFFGSLKIQMLQFPFASSSSLQSAAGYAHDPESFLLLFGIPALPHCCPEFPPTLWSLPISCRD